MSTTTLRLVADPAGTPADPVAEQAVRIRLEVASRQMGEVAQIVAASERREAAAVQVALQALAEVREQLEAVRAVLDSFGTRDQLMALIQDRLGVTTTIAEIVVDALEMLLGGDLR